MRVHWEGKVLDLRAVWMEGTTVRLIDQRRLPLELRFFDAHDYREVAHAIRDMAVRGAPSIGATAAYGMAQAALQGEDLEAVAKALKATRPTAHDLFFAVDVMLGSIAKGAVPNLAAEVYAEDLVRRCKAIGEWGEPLLGPGARVLTHCNAGALASLDYGTALAPIRLAQDKGKNPFVFVDETRPRFQGARLTAWELAQEGIPHCVIADGAGGFLMQRGEVDLVMVGADRITASGDFANKIGTYEKAVVAHENGIPFYVAAPQSTFDFTLTRGSEIPIEERAPEEVLEVEGVRVAPRESEARNPAFDVTPAKYVRGFVTDVGVLKPGELGRLKVTPRVPL